MKRNYLFIVLAFVRPLVFSQNVNDNNLLFKEINNQIFDSDNFYRTSIETDKWYPKLNGKAKAETIIYSDSVKIINFYNEYNSLTQSKVFNKGEFKRVFNYEYADDGKTLLKQTGAYNLDYTVLKKDKYGIEYFAVKSPNKIQSLKYKYLDTLFVKDYKYGYEYIRQSNSEYNTTDEYKYIFKYGRSKLLREIKIFENNIQVGHAKNFYNANEQIVKQELFWEYKWFVEDTGFPSIRNIVSRIKYNKGLITSIEKEAYYPEILEWKKSIINYDCKLKKEKKITRVNCRCDNDEFIIIDIDFNGNWIKKSIIKDDKEQTHIRLLEYY